MKNIWNLLKDDIRKDIEREGETYKNTFNSVKNDCENCFNWSELKLSTVEKLIRSYMHTQNESNVFYFMDSKIDNFVILYGTGIIE
jgi:hypothetical protein